MLRNASRETLIALLLIAPFVAIYGLIFVYPTIQMFLSRFTDAPLIGAGDWVGLENYTRLPERPPVRHRAVEHRLFRGC